VATILIARTDANSAKLILSDVDERDRPFLTGERTREGFFRMRGGLDAAIARGLAYAPLADLLWCETSEPDLDEARRGMHVQEASAVPLCPRHGSCDCRVPAERHLGFGAEVSDVELTCADVPGDDEGCL